MLIKRLEELEDWHKELKTELTTTDEIAMAYVYERVNAQNVGDEGLFQGSILYGVEDSFLCNVFDYDNKDYFFKMIYVTRNNKIMLVVKKWFELDDWSDTTPIEEAEPIFFLIEGV